MTASKHQFPSLGTVISVGCFWSSLATAWFSFLTRNSTSTHLERFISFFPVFFLLSCSIYIVRKGSRAWASASLISALISLFPAALARGALQGQSEADFMFLLWFFCAFTILQWFFLQREIDNYLSESKTSLPPAVCNSTMSSLETEQSPDTPVDTHGEKALITLEMPVKLVEWIDGLKVQLEIKSRGLVVTQLLRELLPDDEDFEE